MWFEGALAYLCNKGSPKTVGAAKSFRINALSYQTKEGPQERAFSG